jgi:hypothetical protein
MTRTAAIDEKPLPLAEAARLLPKRPNPATLWRWRTKGVRGVRLVTSMIGGRRYVTPTALREFNDAVTAAASRNTEPSPIDSADEPPRARSAETSERLKRDGLLSGRRK